VAQDHAALPPWTPGAHLRLHLQDGLVRAYSLCNTPQQRDCYVIAVKREALRAAVPPSCMNRYRRAIRSCIASRQCLPLIADTRAPLLLAAGIGITPLHAMAAEMAAQGRRHRLHYFARSLAHAAFFHELAACSQGMSLHLGWTVSRPGVPRRLPPCRLRRRSMCADLHLHRGARRHAQLAGWREEDIHFELFAAPVMANAETPSAAQAPPKSACSNWSCTAPACAARCSPARASSQPPRNWAW
jgi:vanillate O-demethylase ferredoxin subunit